MPTARWEVAQKLVTSLQQHHLEPTAVSYTRALKAEWPQALVLHIAMQTGEAGRSYVPVCLLGEAESHHLQRPAEFVMPVVTCAAAVGFLAVASCPVALRLR